jgi:hypothetical protein
VARRAAVEAEQLERERRGTRHGAWDGRWCLHRFPVVNGALGCCGVHAARREEDEDLLERCSSEAAPAREAEVRRLEAVRGEGRTTDESRLMVGRGGAGLCCRGAPSPLVFVVVPPLVGSTRTEFRGEETSRATRRRGDESEAGPRGTDGDTQQDGGVVVCVSPAGVECVLLRSMSMSSPLSSPCVLPTPSLLSALALTAQKASERESAAENSNPQKTTRGEWNTLTRCIARFTI